MQRLHYEFNEPGVGIFDNEGPKLSWDQVLKEIEVNNPTFTDIEIISEEEIE